MLLVVLSACTEPPLLGSYADRLAADAVSDGEPAIDLFLTVTGVLAESCGVETVPDHVFMGPSASALGIDYAPTKDVDDASGKIYWTFEPAGLDGEQGKLQYVTDSTRQSFTVLYIGGSYSLNADLAIAYCGDAYHTARSSASDAARFSHTGGVDTGSGGDTSPVDTGGSVSATQEAIVNGSGTYTDTDTEETWSLLDVGSDPYPGVGFTPVDARLPIAGYIRWETSDEATKVTLDDASTLPAGATAWPGTAKTDRWDAEVLVDLP